MNRKMIKNFNIILILVLLGGCSQWSVVELHSRQYAFIEKGEAEGRVAVPVDDIGLENQAVSLMIFNDRICLADNTLKRIQVMDSDGDVELLIGSLDGIDRKKVRSENFNFNTIGYFVMDGEGNLFVQNRLAQGKGDAGEEAEMSPSYILAFDEKGDLQYTLGQKGSPDIPFYNIESMEVDGDKNLIVVTRQSDAWSVFKYSGKKRVFHTNLGTLQFVERDGDEKYQGKIENVKFYDEGGKLMIAVAYYQDWRLAYRKLYEYSVRKDSLEKAIMTIPDPRNVLFAIVNDRLVSFWNIEGSEVRFMYCNMEGSIMKNVRLNIDFKNNYYTRIISDRRGGLYSYSIMKNGVLIQQWE